MSASRRSGRSRWRGSSALSLRGLRCCFPVSARTGSRTTGACGTGSCSVRCSSSVLLSSGWRRGSCCRVLSIGASRAPRRLRSLFWWWRHSRLPWCARVGPPTLSAPAGTSSRTGSARRCRRVATGSSARARATGGAGGGRRGTPSRTSRCREPGRERSSSSTASSARHRSRRSSLTRCRCSSSARPGSSGSCCTGRLWRLR